MCWSLTSEGKSSYLRNGSIALFFHIVNIFNQLAGRRIMSERRNMVVFGELVEKLVGSALDNVFHERHPQGSPKRCIA